MQEIVTGELGKGIQEFYGSTLRELKNAITGFNKRRSSELNQQLAIARIISYYAVVAQVGSENLRNYDDLFKIPEIDQMIVAERIKELIPIQKEEMPFEDRLIKDGKQVNG